MLTKQDLITAIHDTLADRWVKNDFGTALMLGSGDFAGEITRTEVQTFVEGIAARCGLEDAEASA